MGQVVPFIARVRDSGDWTAAERARLEDLADRLAAGGVHVEVIFGATDEGDPWCVVTDQDGDVLIHVARIDGRFVVHSAVDDTMTEGVDLHSALRDRLAATEEAVAQPTATILPFGLTARQGQTLLALMAAVTFFHETALGTPAEAAEPPHPAQPDDPSPPPPVLDDDAPAQERHVATQGAALRDPQDETAPPVTVAAPIAAAPHGAEAEPPAPPPTAVETAPPPAALKVELPAPAPVEEPKPVVIQGTSGDDHLLGTAASEHILGGAGNDTLEGGGGHDTLDGGAGDDRITMTAGVVAIGGEGADSFVIKPPPAFGRPETFFGVIRDFNPGEGDRVLNWQGDAARLTPHPPQTADKTAPPTGQTDLTGPEGADHGFGTNTFTRVDVDLNGDGVADGYLMVGHHAPLPQDDNAVVVVGQSLNVTDPVG